MRNGINGLSRIVRDEMGLAPLGDGIFVFFSKNRQSVKLLRWDSDGFIRYHKRLERGTFEAPSINGSTGRAEMPWRTFSLGRLYRGKAPSTPFLNSSYESSAIAHIMRLRYGYAMPVESICRMLREDGFNMSKKTADGLLRKTSGILESLYLALRDTVLKANYLNIDETYYRILSEKKPETAENGGASGTGCSTGRDTVDNNGSSIAGMPAARGSRKGYIWLVASRQLKLSYFIYDCGSRSQKVILDELTGFHGCVQSDGYSAYKKLETDDYKGIQRISCLQHIKRKFLDCGENNTEARKMVRMINKLYRKEHSHKDDKDWTAGDNLKWRQEYAPPILKDIREKLDTLLALPDKDLPPKSDLYTPVFVTFLGAKS